MSRNVACQSKAGKQREERCDPSLKPISRVQCGTQPCPTWNHGDWGSCNPDCHRFRLVSCQDSSGKILTDERCLLTERPANKTTCNDCFKHYTSLKTTTTAATTTTSTTTTTTTEHSFHLQNFKWKISEWTPCSKSCGRGTKTRLVSCIDVARNVTFVEHYCKHLKKPKTSRNCYRSECNFVWQEGPWTECTKSCGEGMKYRNVTCHRVLTHGRALHPDAVPAGRFTCNLETKPSNYESCLVRYCNEQYSWTAGPWKECSHPCGRKGRQMRHLYCHHNGKKVPKKFCPRNIKPPRKQKCNQKRCTTLKSCLEVKRNLQTSTDGEYDISVANAHAHLRNRNHRRIIVKVFCFQMSTAAPKEFISLPNDGRDNYAEVYDKRLIDAETCPFNGQRNDNYCDCISSDSGLAGLTVFRKIRLNITTMQLVGDDYTFSRQNSGERVPYGTAGDCYSRVNCPQGRFSINLNGTGLRLSSRVRWIDSGIMSSKTIHKSSASTVSGKCGGYCGSCEPDANIGLLVEPDVT